ncbi:hypothetical protein HJ590_17280 [Naumannella sp. ID2617S]|nr:hypothetical protein [Naumannella sp. ID2617S]
MGTTGLIFGAIVAAWLAYLVPMYLRRNQNNARPQVDPEARFSNSVQIVRDGNAAFGAGTGEEEDAALVSTPLTRRAAVTEIWQTERRMAGRRRNVLVGLGLLLIALTVTSALGHTPWWSLAIPGGLIVAFVGVARFSVRAMHRQFEARLAQVRSGDEEDTVAISREGLVKAEPRQSAVTEVELGAPEGTPGTLWGPLPVTRPTYVQAPVAPRTVRTIDLSAPVSASEPPVTADGPEVREPVRRPEPVRTEQPRPRAVGE